MRISQVVRAAALERDLERLKQERHARIDPATQIIREANAAFDLAAVPIMRELARLRPGIERMQKEQKPKRERQTQLTIPDDWSPEEVQHFNELLKRDRAANG